MRHRGLFRSRNTESLLFPNCRYDPAHHFDRSPDTSSWQAYEEGRRFVADMRAEAVHAIEEGRDDDSLKLMGRGMHALQDFFSHSNVIELPQPVQETLIEAMWSDPLPSAVPELVLAEFDGCPDDPDLSEKPPSRKDLVDRCVEDLADTHLCMSKDNPASVQGRSRTGTGQRNFRVALDLAAAQSARFLLAVRDDVGPLAWERVSQATTSVR